MPYIPYSLVDLLASPSFSPHPLVSFSFTVDAFPNPKQMGFLLLAKSIIYQVLSALAYLHDPAQGVIAHRDVKPANVLLARDGHVKLIDFGISWKQNEEEKDKEHDLWRECAGNLYFEVSTGCYRAPELLFGPRTYDAPATDLWSLGAMFAEFFTPLRLVSEDEDSDEEDGDEDSGDKTLTPFILPSALRPGNPGTTWCRDSLFDAARGEIGLAWSIFKTFGTPTDETWPTFQDLPNAKLVQFTSAPAVHLPSLLPNLPSSPDLACDLLKRFIVYPQSERLKAAEALNHPWFIADPPALVPVGYSLASAETALAMQRDGKTLGEWICTILPHRPLLPGDET
ncbi:kinase-like protein [Athelia psychrophila]|uniref:Kinase-like protein n=1 Tax=Athelia psychrophila TaxID=1759441 RepID=A0A166SDB1_9AGAM|nr:kinase-like protein [Fibularhizoctonia sp. CBS 109695]